MSKAEFFSKAKSFIYYFSVAAITLWHARKVLLMLEGNEVDQKFDGGAGEVIVDVDDKGVVKVSLQYSKEIPEASLKANASIGVETNIFKIAEQIAAKTSTTWDDSAIKGLESLLGIVSSAPAVAAPVAGS